MDYNITPYTSKELDILFKIELSKKLPFVSRNTINSMLADVSTEYGTMYKLLIDKFDIKGFCTCDECGELIIGAYSYNGHNYCSKYCALEDNTCDFLYQSDIDKKTKIVSFYKENKELSEFINLDKLIRNEAMDETKYWEKIEKINLPKLLEGYKENNRDYEDWLHKMLYDAASMYSNEDKMDMFNFILSKAFNLQRIEQHDYITTYGGWQCDADVTFDICCCIVGLGKKAYEDACAYGSTYDNAKVLTHCFGSFINPFFVK